MPTSWISSMSSFLSLFFLRFYLFLGGAGREKERERNITAWLLLAQPPLGNWPTTQACALTGNQPSNPLGHRPVLSPLSHTSQASFSNINVFKVINFPSNMTSAVFHYLYIFCYCSTQNIF